MGRCTFTGGRKRRSGAALPTGQICPTAKPYSLDPNAKPVDVIPEDQWSGRRRRFKEALLERLGAGWKEERAWVFRAGDSTRNNQLVVYTE